jgi:hypothetical protein
VQIASEEHDEKGKHQENEAHLGRAGTLLAPTAASLRKELGPSEEILEGNRKRTTQLLFSGIKLNDLVAMAAAVEAGASVSATDEHEMSALQIAAAWGHVTAMEWLVVRGADISAVGEDGVTALQYAAEAGHVAAMEWLVAQGADVSAVDGHGNSALHMAAHLGNRGAAKWLAKRTNNETFRAFTDSTPEQMRPIVSWLAGLREEQEEQEEQGGEGGEGGEGLHTCEQERADAAMALLLEEESEAARRVSGAGEKKKKKKKKKKKSQRKRTHSLDGIVEYRGEGTCRRRTDLFPCADDIVVRSSSGGGLSAGGRGAVAEEEEEEKKQEEQQQEKQEEEEAEEKQEEQHEQQEEPQEEQQQEEGLGAVSHCDFERLAAEVAQLRAAETEKSDRIAALEAENRLLAADGSRATSETNRLYGEVDRLDGVNKQLVASNKELAAAEARASGHNQALQRDLRAAGGLREGLSPEHDELRAKFELLEQMYQVSNTHCIHCTHNTLYTLHSLHTVCTALTTHCMHCTHYTLHSLPMMYQPVQTENEQRKQMLADTRKAALMISQSRLDLELPTKRMGELDSGKLHALGMPVEAISLLQGTVCDPKFYPWRIITGPNGSDKVRMVANWADEQLKAMVLQYDSCSGGKGQEVAEEVLRCNKELQQWNPSGGYCVTIPYHHGEGRELQPHELLEIVVGIDVPGCRKGSSDEGSTSSSTCSNAGGRGGNSIGGGSAAVDSRDAFQGVARRGANPDHDSTQGRGSVHSRAGGSPQSSGGGSSSSIGNSMPWGSTGGNRGRGGGRGGRSPRNGAARGTGKGTRGKGRGGR